MVQPAADTQIREAAFNTLVTQPPQAVHEISQDTSLDSGQDNSEYRTRLEPDTLLDSTKPEVHETTQADSSAGKWSDINLRASYESLSAKINQMLDPEHTVDVDGALQAKLEEMAIAIPDLDTSEQLIYDKSSLSSMETKQLNAILNKYEGAFAKSKLDIGTFRFLTAYINLENENFSYIESERVLKDPEQFEEGEKLVTQLLSAGVIKKATDLSQHCSNLVFVPKKDDQMMSSKADVYLRKIKGTNRQLAQACLDLRRINEDTVFLPQYQLPSYSDLVARFEDSNC